MLDGNTDRISWSAVALGLMAVLGAFLLALFPQLYAPVKDMFVSDKVALSVKAFPESEWQSTTGWAVNGIHYNADGSVTLDTRTPRVTTPHWQVLQSSRKIAVPEGAKKWTLSATVKGTTQSYVHAWVHFYDASGNLVSQTSYDGLDTISYRGFGDPNVVSNYSVTPEGTSTFKTFTKTANFTNNRAKYALVSIQAREGSDVTYKDLQLSFAK